MLFSMSFLRIPTSHFSFFQFTASQISDFRLCDLGFQFSVIHHVMFTYFPMSYFNISVNHNWVFHISVRQISCSHFCANHISEFNISTSHFSDYRFSFSNNWTIQQFNVSFLTFGHVRNHIISFIEIIFH